MSGTTRTITRPQTIEAWLQALTQCLTGTYRPDGSHYVHLSKAAYWQPIRDELQAACRAAHREELPNDWRWQAIQSLAERLLEFSEPDPKAWDADAFADVSFEIADSLCKCGTAELAAWLAENPSRAEFDDPDLVCGISRIDTLLRCRQCEELQLTACALIWAFSDLCC